MGKEIIPINEDDTILGMLHKNIEVFYKRPAVKVKDDKTFRTISYRQLFNLIEGLGAGLINLDFKKGNHIGLISDNRMEWLISDLAILGIGCVDVPRGSSSSIEEIIYILNHSDSKAVFLENKEQFLKLKKSENKIPLIKTIIVLEEGFKGDKDKGIYSFDAVIELGRKLLKTDKSLFIQRLKETNPDDLATIIYTSGTTGEPKGTMLTHRNIMHNVRVAPPLFDITEKDRFLSVLPTWHIFERTLEYMALSKGSSISYSKPVRQIIKEDIKLVKPTYMVCVPRIWEAIYKGILTKMSKEWVLKRYIFIFFLYIGKMYAKTLRIINLAYPMYKKERYIILRFKQLIALIVKGFLLGFYEMGEKLVFNNIKKNFLGNSTVYLISGGASLPKAVDEFFEAIGITILEGYGLTETSPIVCTRRHNHRVIFTVGPPLPEVEVKIVDKNNKPLPPGETGLIKIRGPLIMRGYYKRKDLTAKVIDRDGWFDSGDLGKMTIKGELKITERDKDTIVLLGGENVEPTPIENKLKESSFITQAVVVGQDKKHLGALLVPDFETLRSYKELGLDSQNYTDITNNKAVVNLIKDEIRRLISPKNGFKNFEKIYKFCILPSDFRVGRELTHTMKLKRNVINRLYQKETKKMYGDNG